MRLRHNVTRSNKVKAASLIGINPTTVIISLVTFSNTYPESFREPDTNSKNGEPMILPLGAEAVQIFEARNPQKTGFVFPAESAILEAAGAMLKAMPW